MATCSSWLGSIWIICKSLTCIFAWQSTRLVSGLTRFLTSKLWFQCRDLFWWLDDWCLACTASQYFLWLICQWRIWTIMLHYGRRCNVLEGAEAFFWILMAEGWDMQMPRSEQRSSVRALAPPLRRRRFILLWVALSCWLYWCKQMDVAMHTAFLNRFVVSA